MNRNQKLLMNTSSSLLKQVVVTICGFILPRYMLLYFGSSVNGLVASATQFLSFISLLEMGIGPVIQANLYGPLAKKDKKGISEVVVSTERFFRRISAIFLVYLAILAFVFPAFVNNDYGTWYTISLLIIISISTFAQYFFGMTYQVLLNADQKSYVQNGLAMVSTILNTVFCIVLMHLGASIHSVKLVTALIFVIRPLGQAIYVRRHYELDKKIKLEGEPIKQKWNGFAQHLSAVVNANAATAILTFLSSLENVSVYSVYFTIVNGITTTVMTAATGLEAFFGNMLAKGEKEALNKSFGMIELLIHVLTTIVYTVAAITIVPFISVYTRGINDADYVVPVFGVMLVLAYGAQCLRIPYFRVIKAAGHFKETQNGSFISAALNIVVSVALVFKFGLVGIAIGSLVAMVYHTCYFVWYLKSHILERSVFKFVYYIVADLLIGVVTFFISKGFVMTDVTYLSWVILAIKVGIVTLGVSVVINGIFHGKQIAGMLKGFLEKRRNNSGI